MHSSLRKPSSSIGTCQRIYCYGITVWGWSSWRSISAYCRPALPWSTATHPIGHVRPDIRRPAYKSRLSRKRRATRLSCTHVASLAISAVRVESVLRHFTAARLTRPAPATAQGRFNAFERDVVTDVAERRVALERLRSVLASGRRIKFPGSTTLDPTPEEQQRRHEAIDTAQQAFESLLTPDERRRYRRDGRGYLGLGKSRARRDHRRIDIKRAQFWVARRAYELGRAAKAFPWSQRSMEPDRGRPQVERLGKKYQWIALDELVCRLADNHWISDTARTRPVTNTLRTSVSLGILTRRLSSKSIVPPFPGWVRLRLPSKPRSGSICMAICRRPRARASTSDH